MKQRNSWVAEGIFSFNEFETLIIEVFIRKHEKLWGGKLVKISHIGEVPGGMGSYCYWVFFGDSENVQKLDYGDICIVLSI